MQATKTSRKRLNNISYFLNVLLLFPVLVLGVSLGRVSTAENLTDGEAGLIFIVQTISLLLVIPLVIWSIRRLHDIGKSGWFALFLIPPATMFLLVYLCAAGYDKSENSKWGERSDKLRLFGIEITNVWRSIAAFMVIAATILLGFIFYAAYADL